MKQTGTRTEETRARDRFVIDYARGLGVSDAADAANISRSTAYRLLDRDDVRADIERTRTDIRRRVVDVLADSATDAVTVLRDIALDPDRTDTARVGAARAILAETRVWTEVEELRERLDRIERGDHTATTRDTIRAILSEMDAA